MPVILRFHVFRSGVDDVYSHFIGQSAGIFRHKSIGAFLLRHEDISLYLCSRAGNDRLSGNICTVICNGKLCPGLRCQIDLDIACLEHRKGRIIHIA